MFKTIKDWLKKEDCKEEEINEAPNDTIVEETSSTENEEKKIEEEPLFSYFPSKKYMADFSIYHWNERFEIVVVPFDPEFCLNNFVIVSLKYPANNTHIYFKDGSRVSVADWSPVVDHNFNYDFLRFNYNSIADSFYKTKSNDDLSSIGYYRFSDRQFNYLREYFKDMVRQLFANSVRYAIVNEYDCFIKFKQYNELEEDDRVYICNPTLGPKFPYIDKSTRTWKYSSLVITESGKILTNYEKASIEDIEKSKYNLSIDHARDLGLKHYDDIYDFEKRRFVRARNVFDYKIKLYDKITKLAIMVNSKGRKFSDFGTHGEITKIISDLVDTYLKENDIEKEFDKDILIRDIFCEINGITAKGHFELRKLIEEVRNASTCDELDTIEYKIDKLDLDDKFSFDDIKNCILDVINKLE